MNRSHVFKRAPPVPAVTPAYITKDLVQVLEVLTPRAGTKEEVEISDTEPIASYSWLDEKTPTILVPGEYSPSAPSTSPNHRCCFHLVQVCPLFGPMSILPESIKTPGILTSTRTPPE